MSKLALSRLASFMILNKIKQETSRVVTIAIICSTLASYWKFQYFCRSIVDVRLGSKYISDFEKTLQTFYFFKGTLMQI